MKMETVEQCTDTRVYTQKNGWVLLGGHYNIIIYASATARWHGCVYVLQRLLFFFRPPRSA